MGEQVRAPADIASELLWKTYRPKLMVFARTFGGACAAHPEDIAHDVIALALSRTGRFDGTHAFSTWLYALARNRCVDVQRQEGRRFAILRRNAPAIAAGSRTPPGPEEQAARGEEARAVSVAVEGLRPRDRQIAYLRYYEELPVAAVAEVMSMPEGTVKYRIHRIHEQLRRRLAEWMDDDDGA